MLSLTRTRNEKKERWGRHRTDRHAGIPDRFVRPRLWELGPEEDDRFFQRFRAKSNSGFKTGLAFHFRAGGNPVA
jgi:hypothetical protein